MQDVIVVGAGFGGLAAAALLAKRGQQVLLLEGSNELGGCAGKFDRGGYRFAAGATVGMGFEAGGVLRALYAELGLPLPQLKPLDVIMDVHLPDRDVRYYRATERWYREVARCFPEAADGIAAFYDEVFRVAERMQTIINARPLVPPPDGKSALQMLKHVKLGNLQLLPFLTQTVGERLARYGLDRSPAFLEFLNGQLIDSVQTTADQCPAFLGYVALNVFHRGAYYVYGGLASVAGDLAGALTQAGGDVQLRQRVTQVAKVGAQWRVTTARGEVYEAKQLVLNTSMHSLHDLLAEPAPRLRVVREEEQTRSTWGAYMLYLGCREAFLPPEAEDVLFHQFIGAGTGPLAEGRQFLFSISAGDDPSRAPLGKRAVTISTHTEVGDWWQRDGYEARKAAYQERILREAERVFPQLRASLEVVLAGTPVTFQRFTGRHQGKVGGYRPTGRWSWLNAYSPVTGADGLYMCGDTVFPGAGTLGTALSGWMVADRMKGRGLF